MSGRSVSRSVYLDGDQIAKYLSAIDDEPLRAMVICIALFGCRRSDVFGLTAKSFGKDEHGSFVEILQASKNRPRKVALLDAAEPLVKKWVLPVLPIKLKWEHAEDSIYEPLRRAAKRAGVAYASPNDLRASFAIRMLDLGISSHVVSLMMGTSEEMLRRHYDRARGIESAYRRQLVGLGKVPNFGENTELLPNKLLFADCEKTEEVA